MFPKNAYLVNWVQKKSLAYNSWTTRFKGELLLVSNSVGVHLLEVSLRSQYVSMFSSMLWTTGQNANLQMASNW